MKNIGLVISDTSRSKIYLAMLEIHNLLPNYIIYLKYPTGIGTSDTFDKNLKKIDSNFDIEDKIKSLGISYERFDTNNIHEEIILKKLKQRKEKIFIYSGYGGTILKKKILSLGKKFLHIHGGFLPKYKGSTTNYFSILKENKMGVSAIFLNKKIDSGPLIFRKKFDPPENKKEIDHFYDSYLRSLVLIKLLKSYKRTGKFKSKKIDHKQQKKYFIIHPVLKHISILK